MHTPYAVLSYTECAATNFFSTIDKKRSIFCRKGTPLRLVRDFAPKLLQKTAELQRLKKFRDLKESNVSDVAKEMLLESYSPPRVVINEKFDIIYFQGQTGKYEDVTSCVREGERKSFVVCWIFHQMLNACKVEKTQTHIKKMSEPLLNTVA